MKERFHAVLQMVGCCIWNCYGDSRNGGRDSDHVGSLAGTFPLAKSFSVEYFSRLHIIIVLLFLTIILGSTAASSLNGVINL